MNKKQWIHYIIRFFLVWIFLFGVKFYRETHPKEPTKISAEDIRSGTFPIITDEQKTIGEVCIEKKNYDELILNIKGGEIEGVLSNKKTYKKDKIDYENISMKLETLNYESFYKYDNGDVYILLLKLRPENKYMIKNKKDNKYEDIFILSIIMHEDFDYFIKHSDKMELNIRCAVRKESNRYTCYFIQENE